MAAPNPEPAREAGAPLTCRVTVSPPARSSSSWTTSRAALSTRDRPPTSAPTCCFGSTTAQAGRELVRRLMPLVGSGRVAPDPSAQAWITVAFTYNGLKALGVPQDSLDSFAPEFRQGMAARAARARRRRRERARTLGAAARNAGCARGGGGALARCRAARGAGRAGSPGAGAAAGCRADLAAGLLPAADRADVVRLQGRDRPAGDRGQRHPAHESAWSGRSSPASSSSATRTRPGRCRRCRRPPCSDRTAPTSSFASSTPASPRIASTSAIRPHRVRRRRCSARRWSGAGRAARRSRSHPTKTIPSSARTTPETTPSSTAMIRAGSSARPAPTPAGRTRETRSMARAASTCACIA